MKPVKAGFIFILSRYATVHSVMDESKFEYVRERAENLYASIESVRCPYFGEEVVFNAKGIKHLRFKTDEKIRPLSDQYTRLRLLYLAPQILKLSRTVQGIRRTKQFELLHMNSRWERVRKDVCFFEFMAVLDNLRVKVVVKQVGKGEKYFWSIIPAWKKETTSHKHD